MCLTERWHFQVNRDSLLVPHPLPEGSGGICTRISASVERHYAYCITTSPLIGDAETRKRLEQQRESFGKTNIWLLRRIARLIRRNKKLTKNTERVPSTEISALLGPKENDTLRGL